VLGSMTDISGMAVADLFSGSGALGIEALSRGAARAVFVDDDPAAVRVVRANLEDLGLSEQRSTVVQREVLAWLATASQSFDLALCDPPYAFAGWPALFDRLEADLTVVESSAPPDVPASWVVIKEKRYGSTLVTVVRRPSPRQKKLSPEQKGTL